MKKIHMIAALLAMLLPTALFANTGSSTTYYAALKAQVSSTGGGKVYASTSSSTPSSSSFGSGNTAQDSGSSSGFTFYAHAQANEGYKFKNWTGDFSSADNPYKASVTATSTSSSTYTTKTITANFEPLPPATVTFVAPANGSYTVNGESVSAQLVKSNQAVPYSVTLVATPASNFRFAGWYTLENDVKSFFSTDATTTKKFDVDATVGAEFIPDGFAIYAAVAAKGYDDLATALAEAQSGESISVYSSTTLDETAAVEAGVSLTVASGVTLTIASGKTLYVDGSVSVNGAISGTVSKCTKLVKQTGQATNIPFNPYGDVKYWKTSVITPSITVSSSQTHATIINGLGQPFRYALSSSAKLIKCTIDSSVAVNHVKSIAGESTSGNVVNDTLNSGMVILLGSDCVINGGLTAKTGFRGVVDCAGNKCSTVSGVEVSGNNGKATFLNCPSFTGSKVINITHDYFNCDRVTLSSFNAGGSPILNFYDCGTFSSPASFSASYSKGPTDTSKFNFYSGYYNSLTYKSCFKVYGGSYKSDPATYIADQDNFEAVYDSSSKYYVVQEKTEVLNVAAINGTEYETLSAAIAAAGNGATISLIEGVDLTGTTVEVPSSKNITIALDKHTITGGKIVNRGTLLITDITVANESNVKCDIENYGTLDLVFGTYTGAIANKAGTLTTHNGVFTGTLAKDGGTVNLKGGHFTADVTVFVTAEGYDVFKDADNRFCVCELPNGTMYDATVSGTAGYGATPYSDADFSVLQSRVKNGKTSRSEYSDANWKRLAELLGFYQVFSNKGLDATLVFDRDVAANGINLYAQSTASMPVDFKSNLPAGQLYRALSEVVVFTYGYYAKTYYSIFDESIKSVAMAVSDKSGNNKGTVCKAMVELWTDVRAPDYSSTGHKVTNTVYVVGQKLFTIDAGSNKAMIRPASGAATFYATLGAAMDAATDGGTVMLANDCDTALPLTKAGTYTFDTMGFAASDAVSVSDGLFVKSETAVDSSAKVLVPDAKATTYVVAQKVASVGETFYDNLTEAVGAANGATVTLLAATDETITLGEGQTLSLNKNGIAFDDAKVVTSVEGSSVKATTSEGVTVYSLVKDVVSSGDVSYPSIEAAVAATEGGTVAVTVIAADTETIALVAGKTLSVTVADGVTADVTVNPAEGAFIETSTDGATTTYVSKKITVEMKEPTATVAVTKIDNGTESEVTEAAEIDAAVAKMTGNNDVPRTDNTDKLDVLDKITVTPTKIVEEVVDSKTIIRSATFDVVPALNAGQSLAEGQKLKFRLPVDVAATQSKAIVYHGDARFGMYTVQTYNNEKFIEVESGEFSPYGYELLDAISYNDFVAALVAGNGSFDGQAAAYSSLQKDAKGRLLVVWSPQSGCRAIGTSNHQYAGCDHVTEATYETPNRVNGGCAQYQITSSMVAGNISISNVSFIYDNVGDQADGSFWYDANGWSGTGASGLPGELQLENPGDITIANCSFDGVCLTPYHEGATTTHGLTVTESDFLNNAKSGLRGINSKSVTVTGCTFTDCDKGVDFVSNTGRADGDITLTDNVFDNVTTPFKLRTMTQKVNVTGDNTVVRNSPSGATLFSHDTAGVDVAQYLSISGGTYDLDVTGYTAPTFSATDNGNGTWTVEKAPVAQIGTMKYNTLAEAIATAEAGQMVELIADTTEDAVISIAKNVTVDFGGKTATLPGFNVTGGTVAFKNGSVAGSSSGNSTFQLDGGSVTLTDVTATSLRHVLRIEGASVVIESGSYSVIGAAGGTHHAINIGSGSAPFSTLTIKGGTFTGPKGMLSESGAALCVQKNAQVTVEDGQFSGGKNTTVVVWDGADNNALAISGGVFDMAVDAKFCATGYEPASNTDAETKEAYPYAVKGAGYGGEVLPAAPIVDGNTITVTPENIQYTLDGAYGSVDGKTIILSEGTYPKLYFARATKFPESGTEYYKKQGETKYTTIEDIQAHRTEWGTCHYNRTMQNVTFKPADGAAVTVAGIECTSGHITGPAYDYLLDYSGESGSMYYLSQTVSNITFDGLTFTDKVNFATSASGGEFDEWYTTIAGVTFDGCTFNGSGTASSVGAAIRYYSEAATGYVSGLTVTGCTFNNWYQGVYCNGSKDITVTKSEFDTTGHNAIAVQTQASADAGAIAITDNTFKNIGDRVIRFGSFATGTEITITGNTATNSGDSDGEVIKASGVVDGIPVTMASNTWDQGAKSGSPEFGAAGIGTTYYMSLTDAIAAANSQNVDEITILNGATESPDSAWKVADGKLVRKVYVAQIGTTKYETVEAALADAQGSGATIEILANSTETPDHALEVLMGGNITLTAATPVRVEIAPTAKTSSVDNDGMAYIRSASAAARCTFTVGENVTLAFPATAAGKGAMYIGYSSANAADVVINGRLELYEPYVGSLSTLTVNPSGSIKSVSECLIVRWGATVDIVGTGAEWSDANPQAEFAYVSLQGGVTTLKDTYAKGGAWVQIYDRNNKAPDYATKLVLDNAVLATSKINNQAVIELDVDSQIVTPVVQNTGSINIDATGITQAAKIIDYTGSGTMALADYGTVNVTSGEAYVDGNDLWVKKPAVAQIGTTKYDTFAEAIAAADAAVAGGGEDPVIIALDPMAEQTNPDWKFVTDDSVDPAVTTLVRKVYVAQIGTTKYESLAEAVAAVPTDGTATTITMIGDEAIVGNVGVTIAAGKNITLDLNGHTVSQTGPMAGAGYLIKNLGTLTLKDSTDTAKNGTGTGKMTTSSENPDTGVIPSYANNLISNYGTLTIESGYYESLTNAGYASFVVDNYSGGTANITGGKLCNNAPRAYVVRMFASSTTAENTLNIGGTTIIDGGYAVWLQTTNANANKASLTISGGTLNASDGAALYVGGTKADNSNISIVITDGEINGTGAIIQGPLSGTYKKVEISGGEIVNVQCGANVEDFISGGTFDNPVNEAYCADGYIPTDNGNGTYGVKQGNYVAQLMGDGYVAISASIDEPSEDVYLDMWSFWGMEGMVDANGNACPQYVSITDETLYRDTAVADANGDEAWVSAKYLYENYLAPGKKYYASQTSLLYEEGEVIVAKYESLTEAVAVASEGDTIELIADDEVSLTNGQELTIDKPLTITGPVDDNGDPVYTIYGTPSNTGYNDLFVASSSGTVTISNLAFAEFGNGAANSVNGHAPIFVSASNNKVVLENLVISDFNRTGIKINGGEFLVTNCLIDCSTDMVNYRIGGVDVANAATGTFVGTTITDVGTSDPMTWVSAALELIGSGAIRVEDCEFTSAITGIFVSTAEGTSPGSSAVTVINSTIDADLYALANDSDAEGAVIAVESGKFTGMLSSETETGLSISGGIFDDEVFEEYCASGFIPAANTDAETSAAYPYTVKEGTYVAQIVRGGEVIAKFETFAAALEDAQSGDTVQLLANVEDVTETFVLHGKNITIDGQGLCSITAGENTEPRSVVQSYGGARNMFVVQSGNVTFKDITLDGGETHYYTFLVQAKNGTTTFDNVSLLHGGEADTSGTAGVGYGAAVQVDGATVLVTNSFYACTGTNVNGVTTGVFPFTALLYQAGGIHFADGVTAGIGDDLLLVGMVGAVDVSTEAGREQVNEMLEAMNVPAGYYPYTLKLGDSEMTSFTGASPLGWNGIIDYGKEIMTTTSSLGMEMNPATTPVEVGLLTDTVLPDTFRFADTNFTVNGNGNALAGTIEYTDNAGQIHDIVMGTEGNALVLDMTDTTKPIVIGSGITVSNVTVQMTAEQATAGTPVIIWDAAHGVDAPDNEAGVTVQIVDDHGDSTGVTKDLIWDDEMGMAYIGPCEARLTGPTHDKPVYTTLAHAIELAAQTGDTVTLLMNVTNVTTTYEISKQDLVIDGAGYTVAAAPVTQHRNMFEAWSGSKNMFKLQTGNITFRNITLDGDETHAYTFLISGDNSSVALTTENVRLIHGGEISKDSDNATVTPGNGYGAAIHLNNGAQLVVSNGFYACTGTNVNGVTTGVFPFTAILPENLEAGTSVAFELTGDPNDPANVDIGEDLLLVGMIGDLIDQYGIDAVQGILNYMKVPSRFIPYTLTLADGSAYAFTGASPRRWNDIIDYGKDIMDVATANGFSGLDKDTTPVEVGLATDTVLPAGADGDGYDFLYEDSNFSINGNGNALSGTIKFTDDANGGLMHDIDLGTDDAPLTLDLSATTNAVMLGGDVIISNVVVKLTEDQATLGKVVFEWDSGETPPDDEQGVEVTVVNNSGTPTGETKGLIWDEEYGVAYIGPCEARLTGATHETPVYTSLANALDIAKDNDKVELLTNAVLSAVQGVGSDVTLDLAGYKVSVNGAKGLLVTNATLVIADTSVKTNGTICAGDEASPASLIESGNGGVVNIPTGIFVAASGQNVLVTSDNGAFAVSGGYFSNPVLPEHCAESYMPVDAEAGAPQPYTVAEFVNEFRYPIDGSVGVPVERTWLAQNFSDIYSDPTKPVLANVTNALVEALSENGANEMPRWESYVLGLDPTVVTARLRLTATSKDAATVTIKGLIDMTKFPKPEGTTITFRLAEVNPDGTKKKDLVTDSEEPSFDVLLEEVVGKELAIFADIAVEGVAK